MRRFFVLLLPVLALVTATLLAGEDRKEKGSGEKSTTSDKADKALSGKGKALFNVDEFIKEYDSDKDGAIAKEELPERFRYNFEKIDTDKDGKLSHGELEKGFVHLQARRRTSDFIFILLEMSDCDEGCADELQVAYSTLRKLDKNNDGKIDADELKVGREEVVSTRINGIFKNLDADKDGKLSKDEARGPIKRHFAELDVNKDGFVTRDELMTAASEKPGVLDKGKKESKDK